MDRTLHILDKNLMEHMDTLYLVLVHTSRMTLLPELYEVFGKEAVVKFMDVFAGTTVQVPPRAVLENCVRDVDIYLTLKKSNVPAVIADLALKYSISTDTVYNIRDYVDKLVVGTYNIEVQPNGRSDKAKA